MVPQAPSRPRSSEFQAENRIERRRGRCASLAAIPKASAIAIGPTVPDEAYSGPQGDGDHNSADA